MDVQALQFRVGSFDSAVSTFVFCSVPDPLKGLEELRRVLKPKGKAYFLEHVRPGGFRGRVFDLLAPLFVRITGANINRDTVTNIKRAGFCILLEENLFSDIFKFIIAENSKGDFGE
jgi:ubiquinone/menaquinone biosynthesis C-methylase UbiE